jgi:hypothetical protein
VDRCALFVDASYLLADGALAVHGTRHRDSVSWDYSGLLKFLSGLSRDRSGLPLLRCYWYEATVEGRRTPEHDTLADLPGLKLRLGKMRPGRREGVETQMHRDLTTLGRNGAITDAIVVSGEEDLAEVVAEVQDLGIRVILMHITVDGNWTISRPLRQECDDILEIGSAHLRPFVDLIAGAEPARREDEYPASAYSGRSLANGHGSAVGAVTHHGLPAAALPAPPGIYTAPVVTDYQRAAQPLPGARSVAPDEQRARRRRQDDLPAQLGGSPQGQSAPAQPGGIGGQAAVMPGHPASAQPGRPGGADASALRQAGIQGQHADLGQPAAGQPGQPGGTDPAARPQRGLQQAGNSLGHPAGAQPGGADASALRQAGIQGQHADLGQPAAGQPGQPGGADPAARPQRGLQQAGAGLGQPAAAQPGHAAALSGQPGGAPPGHAGGGPGDGAGAQPSQPAGLQGQPGGPADRADAGQQGVAQSQPGSAQPGHAAGLHSRPTAPQAQPAGLQAQPGGAPGQPGGAALGQQGGKQHGQPGGASRSGSPAGFGATGPLGAPPGQVPAQQPSQHGGEQASRPQGGHAYPPDPFLDRMPAAAADALAGQPDGPQRHGMSGGPRQYPPPEAYPPEAYPPAEQYPPGGGQYGEAGEQLPPGQFPGPLQQGQHAFGPAFGVPQGGPYSGPQPMAPEPPVPQPVAISLADAVQTAHAEGFGFGEAVARDAPALWLEAVLARKPRMPSDLEARLLQGSALPIDSLLHDDVRHALRRGFWDALERSRR